MATFQEMIGVVIPEKLREIDAREDVKTGLSRIYERTQVSLVKNVS